MVEQCVVEGRWADLLYNVVVGGLLILGFLILVYGCIWIIWRVEVPFD